MMSSEKQKCTTENVHSEEDEKCEPSGKFSVSLKAGSKRSGGKIEDKKSVFINIGKKKSDLHTEALTSKKLTVPKPNNENAIHDFKGKAAAVFNNESDSEEEEMPLECRMKMRNMGRDTITSAGPNSFNKGKEGFSHNSFKKFELSMKPRNNKETKHDCKQRNIAVRCKQREVEQSGLKKFEKDVQVSIPFVEAIGLEKELEGHSGCVNCLEWSSCGDYLVSGSDDTQIILWDVRKRKASVKISTSHEGNIFSVKFLPYSSNNIIASSAADRVVNLYDVFTQSEIHSFKCHSGRVKKLAVSNHLPFLLWSGSEDGSVREFDLREPYHECSSSCSNIFINLRQHVMLTSEVKCIQVHPTQPELIAVGCNDAYLRLFDRRMVKQNRATNSTLFDNCVDYFAPGHLLPRSSKVSKRRLFVTTHLAFSPNGAEILQNLGGDHIYSYNLLEKNLSFKFKAPCDKNCATSNELQHNYKASANNMLSSSYATRQSLPNVINSDISHDKAMSFKVKGNEAFSKKNYYQAVVYYNEALTIFPSSSVLLANRAAALLQRKWNGDLYSSLRDSQAAVTLDPLHHKAFLRQVKCLQELRMHEDALKCFDLFKEKFPEQAESATAKQLEADIRKSIITKNADSDNDHSVYPPEYKLNNKEELSRQEKSYDYSNRFVGTCNITTDIKEASYFGSYGQYIVAGSDCGCMFIWERATANILKALHGDESIVNCLQPHPTACLIATSGIDTVVRLWSPQYDSKKLALNTQNLVYSNQKNMNSDPLDEMLRTMGYIPTLSDGDESDEPRVNCATS